MFDMYFGNETFLKLQFLQQEVFLSNLKQIIRILSALFFYLNYVSVIYILILISLYIDKETILWIYGFEII